MEISWSAIQGIDFANRLCEDGRLVLEPAHFQQLSFEEVCVQSIQTDIHPLYWTCLLHFATAIWHISLVKGEVHMYIIASMHLSSGDRIA